MRITTVRLAWFSGTGCTALVAKNLRRELEARGIAVQNEDIRHGVPAPTGSYDLLILCFAVHACNAPHPVMEWARRLALTEGKPAAIIAVSGGGEVTPNLACRVGIDRALARKGFGPRTGAMLTMPSNWITATRPSLAARLLEVLPERVARIVDILLAGKPLPARKPGLGNRLLSLAGRLEAAGARSFGKAIAVGEACNACSLCARRCPVGNIAMEEGRPRFGSSCVLCLSCIYACPKKALVPGMARFVAIPSGFDLKAIEASLPWQGEVDVEAETRGFLWLGLKRYLLED